ncbi:MAG: T9SS type A sorting domain-containing protein [bacterium]
MNKKFTLSLIIFCLIFSFSQLTHAIDPGNRDTISLNVIVDTLNMTAAAELYVYSDEEISGASMGFFWDNINFQMDSTKSETFINDAFDYGPFRYLRDTLQYTNDSLLFLFAGVNSNPPGVAADAGGRRLWTTYYFSISSWGGLATDGITFDTMTFSSGSEYLLVDINDNQILPVWTGEVIFGNPTDVTPIETPILPESFQLSQNYPNPFNPETNISFDIPFKSVVSIKIYNILGEEITTLVENKLSAGKYSVIWDGTAFDGRKVSSGIYLYRINAGNFTETRKMILLK